MVCFFTFIFILPQSSSSTIWDWFIQGTSIFRTFQLFKNQVLFNSNSLRLLHSLHLFVWINASGNLSRFWNFLLFVVRYGHIYFPIKKHKQVYKVAQLFSMLSFNRKALRSLEILSDIICFSVPKSTKTFRHARHLFCDCASKSITDWQNLS